MTSIQAGFRSTSTLHLSIEVKVSQVTRYFYQFLTEICIMFKAFNDHNS